MPGSESGFAFKSKVYAYITDGPRMVVMRHPDAPEVGIQVPGGTIEDGEPPEDAVMREAREETGLHNLRLVGYLGERTLCLPSVRQINHQRFYHLACDPPTDGAEPPLNWHHFEMDPSDGSPAPIELAFCWAWLPNAVPPLSGGQDALIPVLLARMNLM